MLWLYIRNTRTYAGLSRRNIFECLSILDARVDLAKCIYGQLQIWESNVEKEVDIALRYMYRLYSSRRQMSIENFISPNPRRVGLHLGLFNIGWLSYIYMKTVYHAICVPFYISHLWYPKPWPRNSQSNSHSPCETIPKFPRIFIHHTHSKMPSPQSA